MIRCPSSSSTSSSPGPPPPLLAQGPCSLVACRFRPRDDDDADEGDGDDDDDEGDDDDADESDGAESDKQPVNMASSCSFPSSASSAPNAFSPGSEVHSSWEDSDSDSERREDS